MELRPGGQTGRRTGCCGCADGKEAVAFLYRVDLAKPKRILTLAQLHAIEKALASRRIRPTVQGRRWLHHPHLALAAVVDCHHQLAVVSYYGIEKGRAA